MPSFFKLAWSGAFGFRRRGHSTSQAEADPSTITPYDYSPDEIKHHESQKPYSDGYKSGDISDPEPDIDDEGFDNTSIVSARPPSYRSRISLLELPDYVQLYPTPNTSGLRGRSILQSQSAVQSFLPLERLPPSILETIASYLPISSRLSLRYTCHTFFISRCHTLFCDTYHFLSTPSNAILGPAAFAANPKEIRHQRALLLAYLEEDSLPRFGALAIGLQLVFGRGASGNESSRIRNENASGRRNGNNINNKAAHHNGLGNKRPMTVTENGITPNSPNNTRRSRPISTSHFTCSACGVLHPAHAFSNPELAKSPSDAPAVAQRAS